MIDMWNDPERVVAFIGSVISIVSILVNVFQWITNRDLKKTSKSIFLSARNAFTSIIEQSTKFKSSKASDYDGIISSIIANAERGKDHIDNMMESVFK
jgi:hypothetical protein